jgi:predicted RNA binding protein YcfA (HicA-like mRNA interferase family)
MIRGDVVVTIPNPHRDDIGVALLQRILEQAGIGRNEWLSG